MLSELKMFSGMEKSLSNAESLFSDAECLLRNKSYPRAFTLYHLSYEELGRYFLLFQLLIDYYSGREVTFSRLKQLGYNDHQSKLQRSIFAEASLLLVHSNEQEWGEHIKPLWEELNKEFKKVNRQNNLKNESLYVTFTGNEFHHPNDKISEEICIEAKIIAERRLQVVNALFENLKTNTGYLKKHFQENPIRHKILTFPHKYPNSNIVIDKNKFTYYIKQVDTSKCVMIPKSVDPRSLTLEQAKSMI